jgi:lipopolysaccharide biosynthesis glycosyltransferase
LKQLGWNICTVSPITAKHTPFGRFIDQFNKLHIWSFVEYDKIVYLDSDNLVTGNLDGLLERNLTDGKMIAVTQDFFGTRFVETFNMGVFLIHPNLTEFHRLMTLQANDEVKYDTPQAEQGFLNAVYKDQWEEIGIEYNANMAVWVNKRDAWPESPKIKHYTLEKPWQEYPPKYRSASGDVLDAFLSTWKDAARTYGVWT